MKKALSILLSIIMLLGVMIITPLSADAAGNSFSAATSFTLGRTVNGSITRTNTVDYYTFTLSSSGKVKLTASSEMSTYYQIYASTNTSTNIYYKWSESFSENVHLLAGKYFFVVKPEYSNGVGNYNFSMSFTSANESFKENLDTNNNTFTKANTVYLGTKYYGQIAKNDSVDVYSFSLSSSGKVRLAASSDMSTYYQIYASTNTSSNIYYKTSESFSEDIHLVAGKYYLVIKPNYSSGVGNYNFSMSFTSANESFKENLDTNNNTFSKANTVYSGTKYYGQIAENDSVDVYSFTVTTANKVTLTSNADLSIYYQVFSSTNTNTHIFSKTGTSVSEEINLGKGLYYLVIKPNYSSGVGNYSFKLSTPVSPSSVRLNQTSLSLYKGNTATLTATISPSNATSKTITWSSSNTSVATVSAGKVTAKGGGTAKITAKTSNGITAVCTVKVSLYKPYVTNLQNTLYGVKLTWGSVSGAAKYRVYYNNGKSWVKLADTASTSYLHKSVKSGKQYKYTIRCLSKSGAVISDFYHPGWSITYVAAPKAPKLSNTKSGVKVTFTATKGVPKYGIMRKAGNGKWVNIATTTKKTYVDKSAKKGVTYRYSICCVNKNGKRISAYNNGSAIKCKR